MNELDKLEYEDYTLPYELFKANRTHKLIAKAIFNLKEQKVPVSDLTVHNYIEEITEINQSEFIDLISKTCVTFDTALKYIEHLRDIDKKESKLNKLKGMI
jgi:hypothetical protein